AAKRLGFDFERMHREVGGLYRLLHGGLTDAHLAPWAQPDGGRYHLLAKLTRHPGVADWLRFKAVLVEDLLAGLRKTITESAGKAKELFPNAFPPPFTVASGLDFGRIAPHCSGASVKIYSMHWAMMLRFYGDALQKANPNVDERLLVRALVNWFDIADDGGL